MRGRVDFRFFDIKRKIDRRRIEIFQLFFNINVKRKIRRFFECRSKIDFVPAVLGSSVANV